MRQQIFISEFDYELPEELIAQMPADKRENSRMLVLNRKNNSIEHKHFYDILDYLGENDLLVLNDTKVIPARLFGTKETGGKIEIFLLEARTANPRSSRKRGEFQLEASSKVRNSGEGVGLWSVLIKPSKKVKPDTIITISEDLKAVPIKRLEDDGEWLVELQYNGDLFEILHKVGNIPLPPYIERKIQTEEQRKFDEERYQTVYAKDEGSVAAPTAGLHFSKDILKKLHDKGVEIAYVTLNVGLGTFRPVKCENILEHKMHSETFEISQDAAEKINRAKEQGKNIVAVGTTSVRTLETAYQKYGKICACKDHSELFIYPPYDFKVVDKLITNFHLPKSTLLMLVSALAGKDFIFKAYMDAVEKKYRFFSYGDCMFIQ
mgnify:CR=1 FL=1